MVEVGKVKKARGKQWVEVVFTDGSHGFIPGDTRSFSLIQATINQKKAALYGTAARGPVVTELRKGSLIQFLDLIPANGETWIYVQDVKSGQTGYIEGNTKIVRKDKVTKQTGITNMLVGGAFFVVGLIVTIGSYSAASGSGGTYYLCWGAIIFGAIQFIQGLIQFLTAPDK
jgi:hypothetical protein